jgi:hypothetical protein
MELTVVIHGSVMPFCIPRHSYIPEQHERFTNRDRLPRSHVLASHDFQVSPEFIWSSSVSSRWHMISNARYTSRYCARAFDRASKCPTPPFPSRLTQKLSCSVSNREGCLTGDRYLSLHFLFLLWGETQSARLPQVFRSIN